MKQVRVYDKTVSNLCCICLDTQPCWLTAWYPGKSDDFVQCVARCPHEMGTPQFGDPGPHIPSDMGTPGPHIPSDMGAWGPKNSGDMGISQWFGDLRFV